MIGLTWCIPCVTITKGPGNLNSSSGGSSPTDSSSGSSSKSGSTVIKTSISTTSKTVIRRSGSISSNCSHALHCSNSDIESTGKTGYKRPCIKHLGSGTESGMTGSSAKKSGLSQSYDDLLSAASNSSANSTYGFVRPVLKRSSSTLSKRSFPVDKSGYSTGSLCSNKSVKFNLPTTTCSPSICDRTMVTTNSVSTTGFTNNPVPNQPLTPHQNGAGNGKSQFYYLQEFPGNYFICQNICGNCGMCPLTSGNSATPAFYGPNVQYALIQAQNFYNYQIQSTTTAALTSSYAHDPGLDLKYYTGSSIYFGPACNGIFLNMYRQFSKSFFHKTRVWG